MPIEILQEKDIGRRVTYAGFEKERGRIKSFDNENKIARVVYKAAGNMSTVDLRKNYTGVATNYSDLYFGTDYVKENIPA